MGVVQRVVPDCVDSFLPLQHAITTQFFPSLLGGAVTDNEKLLLQLPTSPAGPGIYDSTATALQIYNTSKQGTATVSGAIKGVTHFHHEQHLEALNTARKLRANAKEQDYMLQFQSIILTFNPD